MNPGCQLKGGGGGGEEGGGILEVDYDSDWRESVA